MNDIVLDEATETKRDDEQDTECRERGPLKTKHRYLGITEYGL